MTVSFRNGIICIKPCVKLCQYFSVKNTDIGRPAEKITLPSREEAGVSSTEYDNIVAEVEIVPNKRRRTTYHGRDKVKIAKYANTYGVASAIKFFQRDFPKLIESNVRSWLKKYRAGLQKSSSGALPVISTKRERPLLLPDEIDQKLRMFINNTRKAGGTVNKHVVYGVLMGLIKSDLACKLWSLFGFCDYERLVTVPLQKDELNSQNGDNVKACYHTIDVVGGEGKVFTRYCVSCNRTQSSR